MKTGSDRKYTPEFRAAAVKQVMDGARSVPAVARSLEMSPKTLANWVGRARKGQELVKREQVRPVTELEAELSRLRQENARLRLEKEILKNRPRATSASHMHRNRRLHWRDARTVAVCFLEASIPVKKPGPGEAADPAVVALSVTPFRKVI